MCYPPEVNSAVRLARRRAGSLALAVVLLTAGAMVAPATAELPSPPVVAEPGMVKGPATAPVTIVEFSDYQ